MKKTYSHSQQKMTKKQEENNNILGVPRGVSSFEVLQHPLSAFLSPELQDKIQWAFSSWNSGNLR